MSRKCARPNTRGFTLVEVLVVVASLGMILWMVGQLLFPMRQAAERQRLQVEARQTARSASDYVAFALRGSTDLVDLATPRNPGAVLTFVWNGDGTGAGSNPGCDGSAIPGCIQTAYDNVATAGLATPGTDIITFARPASTARLRPLSGWTGSPDSSQPTWWAFDQGCPSDAANFQAFKDMSQRNASTGRSAPMVVFDGQGNWAFYQVTDYMDSSNAATCSAPPAQCFDSLAGALVPCVRVTANPGNTAFNAPGANRTLTSQALLNIGAQFISLRVCDGWLEQKAGIFDPTADANCPALAAGAEFPPYVTKAGWSPLLPNVEDLQIAYLFADGTVGNGPAGAMTSAAAVPVSMGTPLPANDIKNVTALRVTVTARSTAPMTVGGGKISAHQPPAEDHDPGVAIADLYYRAQVTSVALLRNRLAGW